MEKITLFRKPEGLFLSRKCYEWLEDFQKGLVKVGVVAYSVFIYQMCCAVGAVDFFAFTDFAVAFAARFQLRAPVAIS
jgi:hypothetical protein